MLIRRRPGNRHNDNCEPSAYLRVVGSDDTDVVHRNAGAHEVGHVHGHHIRLPFVVRRIPILRRIKQGQARVGIGEGVWAKKNTQCQRRLEITPASQAVTNPTSQKHSRKHCRAKLQ